MERISSGSAFLDYYLGGGYEKDVVTAIYGPSGSGKTNLCLLAAISIAKEGKKVIYIDTEGGICVERMKQIAQNGISFLPNILIFNSLSFKEQKETFEKLKSIVNESIGLIVVDSISMLYRLGLGQSEEISEVNSALGKQIATLVEITRRSSIPVIITTQVYADFDNRDQVRLVGGDLLKYGSKCLLELRKNGLQRSIILRKHRSLPEGKEIHFNIVEAGIEERN